MRTTLERRPPSTELDASTGVQEERRLVEALRRGEESAFTTVVDRYGASMLRASRLYASSQEAAEEIVQDTWLQVLRGLDGFQGRSSLRTWIFVILGNCARRRLAREERAIPFSSLERDRGGPAVGPEHFFDANHPRWPRCWSTLVDGWAGVPEERLLSHEVGDVVRRTLARLSADQRAVMTLRDVEGWGAEEVCDFLGLSAANQRVLLHRARTRVRESIRLYLGDREAESS